MLDEFEDKLQEVYLPSSGGSEPIGFIVKMLIYGVIVSDCQVVVFIY